MTIINHVVNNWACNIQRIRCIWRITIVRVICGNDAIYGIIIDVLSKTPRSVVINIATQNLLTSISTNAAITCDLNINPIKDIISCSIYLINIFQSAGEYSLQWKISSLKTAPNIKLQQILFRTNKKPLNINAINLTADWRWYSCHKYFQYNMLIYMTFIFIDWLWQLINANLSLCLLFYSW